MLQGSLWAFEKLVVVSACLGRGADDDCILDKVGM